VKRSEINRAVGHALEAFRAAGWTLPPSPRWDVTDFGLGDFTRFGLVLVNLAEEAEYCEKLMWAAHGMVTPAHTHRKKKEDIIARRGTLRVRVWPDADLSTRALTVRVNGISVEVAGGDDILLPDGHRITLLPGQFHAFESITPDCVIGEVSTANDDAHDNIFVRRDIGRFAFIEEDEPATMRVVSDA